MRLKSLLITLENKTLADRFSAVSPDIVVIDDLVTGRVLDFNYAFKVHEWSRMDDMTTITGAYDIAALLEKPLATDIANLSAVETITEIAAALGKTAVIDIDDFYPQKPEQDAPTAKEVISHIFGWTDKVPQRLVNVFERAGTIHVIQRGKESRTVEITQYNQLNVSQRRVSVLQSSTDTAGNPVPGTIVGGTSSIHNPNSSAPYLSGTFSYGSTSVTYSSGLVTREAHEDSVTTYSYSRGTPPAELRSKTTTTDEGRTTTDYDYSGGYLVREVERHYDADNKLTLTRTTHHHPLGQGMWATVVEEDGVQVSTSIGQGAPGGEASAYTINEYSRNRSTSSTYGPPVASLSARPKLPNDFPISDEDTINAVAAALEWIDGKVEERVNLYVYSDTVIDFTTRILWHGNIYYLESNRIQQDPNNLVQQIEMVRWF